MNEKPNYYAIIPATVRYDNELTPNEKLLYGEITSLTQKTGECWATNSYFAELYNLTPQSVSRMVRHLAEKGYLIYEITYKKDTKEIDKRIIKLPININVNTYYQKCLEGINTSVKENNTSINNTSKKEIYKERFKKPTLEEVKAYCTQRNNKIDAQRFIDFYEANNWTDSKGNKVKSWKQKIITWESHQPKQETKEDIIPEWFNKDLNNPDLATANEMNKILEELQDE